MKRAPPQQAHPVTSKLGKHPADVARFLANSEMASPPQQKSGAQAIHSTSFLWHILNLKRTPPYNPEKCNPFLISAHLLIDRSF
ncbi:MAG: hypothetical protein PSN37_02770 [Alphaproteobacteria bacterium]|nr:hypothetical protein [Alphaproteobacteria bacterium]